MRIQCENCDATYTIDDAQLSDQPIGAQCPYCGHVRLVKRGDGAAAPPYTSAPTSGLGGPPPVPAPSSGYGHAFDPFGPGGATAPNAGAPYSGDLTTPDYGAPPSGYGAPAGGPVRSGDLSSADLASLDLPQRGPAAGAYAPAGGGFGADLGAPASGDLGGGGDATCQVCGVALVDEFDKVIGLCDEHQRDRGGASAGPSGSTAHEAPPSAMGFDAGAGSGAHWHVRTRDGRQEGPMDLDHLRNRIRSGEFSVSDEFSADGIDFGPISRHKELAYLASLANDRGPATPFPTGAGRRLEVGRVLTPILAIVVLGGLAYLGYMQRDTLLRVYQGLTSATGSSGPTTPNPLRRYLAKWRLRHPDLSGSAAEHLQTAVDRHLEDTPAGYQAAERAYERALLLDANNAEAIAGYVENLAQWRYASASADELRVARAAAKYAKELAPEQPGPYRAHGALALAKGDLNGCRAGADGALQRSATDGRAKLLLAGCYLQGNVQLAITEAERAKQLLPSLRRADRLLARAYAHAGRFASAKKALDARLAVDPENPEVLLLYGDVERMLGENGEAAAHYKRASKLPGDEQAALLALAELAYEEADFPRASQYFDAAARAQAMHGRRASRVYAGWASSELLRKRPGRAIRLADQALSFAHDDPAALLVRGQAALMAGSATTAATYARRTLDVRNGEPAALVLQGRAFAAQRLRDQAIKSMEEAINNDPRDPRLKGILAALYLSLGASPQAYALMRRASEIDPLEADARNRVGPLALSQVPVREALAQFRKSAAEERNASVASSAMGMLYYHLGDKSRANASIARALRLDGANATALLYDAQLSLDRGNPARAEAATRKLLAVERGSALGSLVLARALAKQKQYEEARRAYESALRANPGLMAAKIELAGLDLEAGDREVAVENLLAAYRVDPHNLRVRRLLDEAGI